MRTVLSVLVSIMLWGCIAGITHATWKQLQQNRREGQRLPPWWFWLLVALGGIGGGFLFAKLIENAS